MGAKYSKLLFHPDYETKFDSLHVLPVSSRKQVMFQMQYCLCMCSYFLEDGGSQVLEDNSFVHNHKPLIWHPLLECAHAFSYSCSFSQTYFSEPCTSHLSSCFLGRASSCCRQLVTRQKTHEQSCFLLFLGGKQLLRLPALQGLSHHTEKIDYNLCTQRMRSKRQGIS